MDFQQFKHRYPLLVMALVQFGQGISGIRGSIAGTTFSRNGGGNIMRNKVTPINPDTTYQSLARNSLSAWSQAWRGLTEAQRTTWNDAAPSFPYTNVFGESVNPSGKNLYVSLNVNLELISGSALTEAPTPASVPGLTTLSFTMAKGTPALSITFTPGTVDSATDLLLFATPGLSPGIGFVKSQLRKIAVIAASDTSPYDGLSDYTARFGVVPAAGQKVFIRVVPIENTTGQAGIGIKASAIVAS